MDISYVPDFSENESEEEEVQQPKRKRCRTTRVWVKEQEFDRKEDAEEAISSQKIWSKSSVQSTSEGVKVLFRCSGGKYRTAECPAGVYLFYHCDSEKVSVFKTDAEHENHDCHPTRGLSTDLKVFIRQKFDEGIRKPNAVLHAIRCHPNMTEPLKAKVVSFLQQVRCEKYGQATVSGTEINSWCSERTSLPSTADEPFVMKYCVRAESTNSDEQELKIVVSTRRLLENMKKSCMVQTDATYKVIWQGYPVMLVGTSDKSRTFHPFAVAVCNNESASDFAFIFDALRTYDLDWHPDVLLADASQAITAGYTQVFGAPVLRIMCYFHVLKNLETYLKPLPRYHQTNLKSDIRSLQVCWNADVFKKASSLFVKKWAKEKDPRVKDFITYFTEQWLSKNCSWYEGFAVDYPTTNNGIEGTNAVMKAEHTLRERLPVGQFLNNLVDMVRKWSEIRNPDVVNCVPFHTTPPMSLRIWTDAYQWAALNVKALEEKGTDESVRYFYVRSSSTTEPITKKLLAAYKKEDWRTFDDYKCCGIYKICITESESTCTCPSYLKQLQCKHVIGMKIRLKLLTVPAEAKSVPLGQKRKRGRPTRARKALIVQ
jgi:hypothetical protein